MSELRDLLERARTRAPEAPADLHTLSRRRDRRHLRKRITAGVVAFVVAAAGTVVAYAAFGNRPARLLPGGRSIQYVDPRHGWTMDYPEGWRLQRVDDGAISYSAEGILVSNVDREVRHPTLKNGWTSEWDLRRFPTDTVIVEVIAEGGLYRPPDSGPYRGRLSLANFETAGKTRYETIPRMFKGLASRGISYFVNAYIGPTASHADRKAAADAVASLRFVRAGAHSASPTPTASPTPSPSPSPMPLASPSIGREVWGPALSVTCSADGAHIDPNAVARTGSKGLHIHVDNQTALTQTVAFDGSGNGTDSAPGASDTVVPIPPGDHTVQCYPKDGYAQNGPTFRLEDPDGFWVSPDVTCQPPPPSVINDCFDACTGEPGTPEQIVRRDYSQIRDTDTVERAGYVARTDRAIVRVVRDGQVLLRANLSPYGGNTWRITDYQECSDF